MVGQTVLPGYDTGWNEGNMQCRNNPLQEEGEFKASFVTYKARSTHFEEGC